MIRDEDQETEATPPRAHSHPPSIGPYRVDDRLGRGGMGEVYRGHDARLDRPVALKRLRVGAGKDADTMRQRFQREARALARVRHPAVVEIYDWVETSDGDWLVMEMLDGRSLGQLLRAEHVTRRRALEIARDLASGLVAVHGEGIVHRDLKPDNVMVLPPDGRVKLVDFGLAKRVESMDGVTLTETLSEEGQILGTVRFMSPEQASGYRLDARSDLFSLGVMLYEMLSGVSPFRGATSVETLTRICTMREVPLRHLVPDLPEAVAELVRRMLAKEPERRVESARDVDASLSRILDGVALGQSDTELLDALPDRDLGDASSETRADVAATDGFTWAHPSPAAGQAVDREPSAAAPAHHESKRAVPRHLAIWAAVVLAVATFAWFGWTDRPPPLDVAVLPPVAGSIDDSVSPALVAGAVQGAIERRLTLLDGISLAPSQALDGLDGLDADIARALAVDEVVSSRFDCAARLCQVRMRRVGADGELLWSLTVPSRADELLALHHAVDQTFRRGYAERRGLPGADELEVTIEDYETYLTLGSEAHSVLARGVLDGTLQQIRDIQTSSPTFMDAHLLEGRLLARRFLDTRDATFRDRAIEAFDSAHDLAPRNPLPLIDLADFARQSGAVDDATAAIETLRDLIGGHPRVLALEALMAEQSGAVD
ncbi:MAG: protein kinase, partial [Acidobacteriota bacterium]